MKESSNAKLQIAWQKNTEHQFGIKTAKYVRNISQKITNVRNRMADVDRESVRQNLRLEL